MAIIVQKYGGSSVADTEKIIAVAEHIKKTRDEGEDVVVVVSARGNETDNLIKLSRELCGGPPPKAETDRLLSTGEVQSAALLAMTLDTRFSCPATSLTSRDIELIADSEGRAQRVQNITAVKELLKEGRVAVVAGFQGIEEGTNRIIILGRGGSDLTAIALVPSLGGKYCEIYTDVDGIYTIDPRIVSRAKRFDRIPYSQMALLAGAGAGVLMPRSVILAQNLGVEVKVLLSPSFGKTTGGTLVSSGSNLENMETLWTIPGIAAQREIQIKVSNIPNKPGMASEIFGSLSDINLLDSAQVLGGETADISILCLPEDSDKVLCRLHGLRESEAVGKIEISLPDKVAGLTVVCPLMQGETDYLHRICVSAARAGANVEMISSAGSTILVVVREENLRKVALALGEEFNLIS